MPTTNEPAALLDSTGTVLVGIYLLSLIVVGIAGRIARRENTMDDFYLSGRNMGFFVLFLTLYATQYSGNTLIGFAGRAYREGFFFLVSVTFMMSVVGAYQIYAPRLFRLSREQQFITVGDYLQHRFGSTALTILGSLLCLSALANYILSNLKAVGYIVETSTGNSVSFAQGVVALSVIMVVYETLGGLRSVAWTDVIQGVLLLIGCACLFVVIEIEYGGLTGAASYLMENRADVWRPPDWLHKRTWMSTLVLIFFGISIYPHAIQRIYAARDKTTLQRSLQVMVFMPLVTTFFMVVVGVVGSTRFPNLSRDQSEQISLLVLNDLAAQFPGLQLLLILFLAAAIAAIMSTVDSALLSLSAHFTEDFYRHCVPSASQKHLTFVGKVFSWAVMALMAYLAIALRTWSTIWKLIEIKLEILCQLGPAVFLGLHFTTIRAREVLVGMLAGLAVVLALHASYDGKPLGIHPGVWGLALNMAVVALWRSRGQTVS